ncbi:MAG: hypothetical protein JNJ85_07360 [Candidatus Kapabacteria bacterium]|nr:hypothetical protein [Candidatus Kapabacteria bacterium]
MNNYIIIILLSYVSVFAQEYEWGYRFKVGQAMRFKVDNSVYMPGTPVFVEQGLLELSVLNVAKNGDITFLLKEGNQTNPIEPMTIGSEHGKSVSIRHTTVLDGSEATITMTRYGEFVTGVFSKPSKQLEEERALRAKATTAEGKKFVSEYSDLPMLNNALRYYFPLLKKTKTISVNDVWVDSTAKLIDVIVIQNGVVVNDTAKQLQYQVTRYIVKSDTTIQGETFLLVEQHFKLQQPISKQGVFIQEGDGEVIIKKSDGTIVKKVLDCDSRRNGVFESKLNMYQKLLK